MKRVPLQSITLIRDKKVLMPPIGEAFDFTDDEVAQIEKMNPDAIGEVASVNVAKAEKASKADKSEKTDL
jgi:hypothetical protein